MDELLKTISETAYLYKTGRLKNTYFWKQDKMDIEHLLTLLRKHNYKDSKYGFIELDDLISELDEDGRLPEKIRLKIINQ